MEIRGSARRLQVRLQGASGTDGQPGVEHGSRQTDAIFSIGHNIAEMQTVLWTRVLDRRQVHDRRKLSSWILAPRLDAKEADADLALKPGTNIPIMNGLLHVLIETGLDRSGISMRHNGIRAAAANRGQVDTGSRCGCMGRQSGSCTPRLKFLVPAPTLVSTVLQGVYQSMQATAAACQVNTLHPTRRLIGRKGVTFIT